MIVNRKELVENLSFLNSNLSSKDLIEESTQIMFSGNYAISCNEYLQIIFPIKTDFIGSVRGREFYSVLTNLKSDQIELVQDCDTLVLKSKEGKRNIKYKFSMLNTSITNTYKEVIGNFEKPRNYTNIPEDFIEGIQHCLFSVMKESVSIYLNCMYFRDDKIYSSDNFRISRYTMNSKIDGSFLLPLISLNKLVKFDINKYYLDSNKIYFTTRTSHQGCLVCIDEKYPDCNPYFDNFDGIKINFPIVEVIDSLNSLKYLLSREGFDIDKNVKITVLNNKLICEVESSLGHGKEEIELLYEGEEFSFDINYHFLYQVLDKTETILIANDKSVALFKEDNFEHLILLP